MPEFPPLLSLPPWLAPDVPWLLLEGFVPWPVPESFLLQAASMVMDMISRIANVQILIFFIMAFSFLFSLVIMHSGRMFYAILPACSQGILFLLMGNFYIFYSLFFAMFQNR